MLGLKITPDAVVRVVKEFVEEKKLMETSVQIGSSKTIVDAREEKRKRSDGGVLAYWHRVSEALPADTVHVWSALEKGMREYYEILQQRSSLVSDIESLRKQNMELSVLLQQYLNDKVVDELVIPPTMMMR